MSSIPALLRGLCDDAALFPPGNAPLPEALISHARYRASDFADLVGPLIFPIPRLDELAASAPGGVAVVLTAPGGPSTVAQALERAETIVGAQVVGLEIAPTASDSADEFFASMAALPIRAELDTYVEVPRDERRTAFLDRLADSPYAAKFRTGGVVEAAYPGVLELAESVKAVVDKGIAFKATAGLHHAVRNTDPHTGFEQHGFLNLLLATRLAAEQADLTAIEAALADRAGSSVAAALADLTESAAETLRAAFRSFGTCSIDDPRTDLVDLNLLPAALRPATTSEGSPA
ncbi:hypothetical protein [Nocardia callitridis]|uniref:Uncharacterized protein n=1 Tax=Nocardia callitridis TaxID=648753 RepID=A0ABP9K6I3_9NOCA